MKKILTKKGFTLIELIVVIAILAILAAILIPSLTNYLEKATIAKNQANARSYYSAIALEVATNPLWVSGSYTKATASPALPANQPCAELDFVVSNGSVTSYSCKIGTKTFSAPNFVATP